MSYLYISEQMYGVRQGDESVRIEDEFLELPAATQTLRDHLQVVVGRAKDLKVVQFTNARGDPLEIQLIAIGKELA